MQQTTLIRLLKEVVAGIASSTAVPIVDLLYGKKNVNEFLIAKKLKLNINQARNILYKLVDEGLVSFIRKKDTKNGGWYTYYWTLDTGKALQHLRNALLRKIGEIEEQGKLRKTSAFYICKNCDIEMNEEQALLNNFTCPECGQVLELRDNSDLLGQFEQETAKYKTQLASVDAELTEIYKKENQLKERRKKAEAKKKAAVRAQKRKERQALAASTKKASAKKASKAKKPAKAARK